MEVLAPWRVLSPVWLSKHGLKLKTNANHDALVRNAARTGLPIITTNFDMLFEDAAKNTGLPPVTILPRVQSEATIAGSYSNGHLHPGIVNIFKAHGSIMVRGAERLDTLGTTIAKTTARNKNILGAIEGLLEDRRLVFLGYSGCDIDFFPSLASMHENRRPYWFDPRNGADKATSYHIEHIGAEALFCDLRPS